MPFIVKIKKQLALYELTVDLETEAGILAVIGGSGSGKKHDAQMHCRDRDAGQRIYLAEWQGSV